MFYELAGFCFSDASGMPFHYDFRLAVLSYIIAVCGSYAALEMVERWKSATSCRALYWQLASATTLGGSIWSMHFIGMLALKIMLPIAMAPMLAGLSFAVAVVAAWCGMQMLKASASWPRIGGAGLVVGTGISAMHYIGMAGLSFPGTLAYNAQLFALSVFIAIAAATSALWLSLKLRKRWHRGAAALIMGGAICGMHYTGVAAAVFEAWPMALALPPALPAYPLGMAVALSTLALLVIGLVIVSVSRLLVAAAQREAETLRDANARLAEVNAELDSSRNQMDVVLNSISQGVCFIDSSLRVQLSNRRFAEIYKLDPNAADVSPKLADFTAARYRVGTNVEMPVSDYIAQRQRDAAAGEIVRSVETFANGRVVAICRYPQPDGSWVSTQEDITDRKQAEDAIRFLAYHDPLTRLPNRALFQERLGDALAMAARGTMCAILCLDLDHFKLVNDTLGHPVGDKLLKGVAERLQACLRETDTLARLGGDEFAIVQVGLEKPEDASQLAHRLITTLSHPFEIDGHVVACGTSVGIAIAPADGASADVLLKSADIALYLAKSEGRGTARFFEPEMDARVQLRRAFELELRDALAHDEFELHFQPTVDVTTGRITTLEALVRWQHPTHGLVGPAEFIPVAEETGLIVAIGELVLRKACLEAMKWPSDIKVAVNVSPAQFRKSAILTAVRSSLDASGLDPRRLEVEITESVLLNETAEVTEVLTRLRAMGVTVALDDFGTGYSSLSYLRKFRFGKVKIDQSFVRDPSNHSEALAIIRAVTALGKNLGMAVTVEGVETDEQLAEVREQGCTAVQGYLFSRPKPACQVASLIRDLNSAEELVA